MSYCGFNTYAEMRDAAMRSQVDAEPWFNFLRATRARRDAENHIIKTHRAKHPGLADFEILAKFESYLTKNFPVPSFEEI